MLYMSLENVKMLMFNHFNKLDDIEMVDKIKSVQNIDDLVEVIKHWNLKEFLSSIIITKKL